MAVRTTRLLFIAGILVTACGNPQYTSSVKDRSTKKSSAANSEGLAGGGNSKSGDAGSKNGNSAGATPEQIGDRIAVKGMSLDLHAIVDISGSLKTTDAACKRFDALKVFFKELKTTLGAGADARLSLTVFSSRARFVGTDENFLNLSDEQFEAKYKATICYSAGYTHAAQAFSIASSKARELIGASPKQISSALIFTDGFPNVVPLQVTLQEALNLRDVFPERVFGILLKGDALLGGKENFLPQMTGSVERVREVGQVDDLANALNSFLK